MDAEAIAAKLTQHERDLLMGNCDGWGSWMFTAGQTLCMFGLGRKSNGSIYLDTPLADEVRAHLKDTQGDKG